MQFEEPLFNIHLNVDYPFNLTGILYFPKLTNDVNIQKDKIQLYQNQVFVTDNVEGIVPEFLTLLRGVIDSPDIPLNVSRSYLQADGAVKKISAYINPYTYYSFLLNTKSICNPPNHESFFSNPLPLKFHITTHMVKDISER